MSKKAAERSKRYYEKIACDSRNELAKAKELLMGLVILVEWWAPRDGVQRTAEAQEFLRGSHDG